MVRLTSGQNLTTNDLEIRNAGAILEAGKRQVGKIAMAAYLDVLIRANPEIFMEVKTMPTKTKKRRTFEEVFTEAGIIPEWISRGEALEKARGEARLNDVARNLLAMNLPVEMIAQAVQMPVEQVHALADTANG